MECHPWKEEVEGTLTARYNHHMAVVCRDAIQAHFLIFKYSREEAVPILLKSGTKDSVRSAIEAAEQAAHRLEEALDPSRHSLGPQVRYQS